jgi:hypothetical protein
MTEKHEFTEIAVRFTANTYALKTFNEQIGRLAEEHDRNILEQFTQTFARLLGRDPAELVAIVDEPVESLGSVEGNLRHVTGINTTTTEGAIEVDANPHQLDDGKNNFLKDPEKTKELYRAVRSLRKGLPVQAMLLRQGALTNLLMYFEMLVSDLIHLYYQRYPSALPSEDRLLSLAELKEIGTVEGAERYLVDKEVDTVLRTSTQEQLEYFSKRLKVDTGHLSDYRDDLVEISQRRNIVVHNRGIANKAYLTHVSESLIKEESIQDGQQLVTSEDYLTRAIDTTYLCGVMLMELCWRKWDKASVIQADRLIVESTYETLLDFRYELTTKLSGFAAKLRLSQDRDSRIVTVNHAIALKEMGKTKEMEGLLLKYDWSSCSLEFQAALYALRNDEENLVRVLTRAIPAQEVKCDDLKEWPLFRSFRKSSRFAQLMNAFFPSNWVECPDSIGAPDGSTGSLGSGVSSLPGA